MSTPTEQPQDKPQKGSFVLFKNEKKEGDHPRKPVYSGSIELPDGTKFDLAGWVNDGKPGSKMEGKKYIKGEVSLPWVPQHKGDGRVDQSAAAPAKSQWPSGSGPAVYVPKDSAAPAPKAEGDDVPW